MNTGFSIGKSSLFRVLIFSTLAFPLFSCGLGPGVPVPVIPEVDTNIYVILPYDSAAMMAMNWRYKNARPDHLTRLEVDSLEAIIDSAYQAYTRDSTAYLHDLLPLSKYYRQYVAVVTDKGEREVWVNFVCGGSSWRSRPVIVDDGGSCFVQLFINLTKRKAYDLIPGGTA